MPISMAADGMVDIPFAGIRKVFEKAARLEKKGMQVIHLEVGKPDFDTPEHIKAAAVAALAEGFVHYTPNKGVPVLREALAESLENITERRETSRTALAEQDTDRERLQLEADLRHAISEGNQLLLHYQPKVDVKSGQITGVEALIRWQKPTVAATSTAISRMIFPTSCCSSRHTTMQMVWEHSRPCWPPCRNRRQLPCWPWPAWHSVSVRCVKMVGGRQAHDGVCCQGECGLIVFL